MILPRQSTKGKEGFGVASLEVVSGGFEMGVGVGAVGD